MLEVKGDLEGVRRASGAARRVAHRPARRERRRPRPQRPRQIDAAQDRRPGNLEADAGKVQWGHETRIGYFAQDHHEILRERGDDAARLMWEACPTEGTAYVRGQLGRVLFSRRGRHEARRRALRRRSGAPRLRAHHGREAQRARPRRADQPPRPRVDPRPRRGAPGVRRARCSSSPTIAGSSRRSRRASSRSRRGRPARLPRDVRRVPRALRRRSPRRRRGPVEGEGQGKAPGPAGDRRGGDASRGRSRSAGEPPEALPARRDKVLAQIGEAEARSKAIQRVSGAWLLHGRRQGRDRRARARGQGARGEDRAGCSPSGRRSRRSSRSWTQWTR